MGMFDSISEAASDIFGGIGSAANALGDWAKANETGALLIGGVASAGAKYMTQKSADAAAAKREKDAFRREAQRYDELHQVADLKWQDPTMDAGTLAGMYRYRGEDEGFEAIGKAQGLEGNTIRCLLADPSGDLWVGSN